MRFCECSDESSTGSPVQLAGTRTVRGGHAGKACARIAAHSNLLPRPHRHPVSCTRIFRPSEERLTLTPEARSPMPSAGKPNILVIMSDEHNACVTGLLRQPRSCGRRTWTAWPVAGVTVRRRLHELAAVRARRGCRSRRASTSAASARWSNNCWLPSDDDALDAARHDRRRLRVAAVRQDALRRDAPLRLHRDRRQHEPAATRPARGTPPAADDESVNDAGRDGRFKRSSTRATTPAS